MTDKLTFADYAARLRGFIALATGASPTARPDFEELALALFKLQFDHVAPYQRLCLARGVRPESIRHWSEVPAVPASAFKELELTSLANGDRTTVFHSSGTTGQERSRHFHSAESLALYEASLLPWFEQHMLVDVNDLVEEQLLGPLDKLPFLALTPPPAVAPRSSLVHMFDAVRREFGARDSIFAGRADGSGAWTLDLDAALFAIRKSMCANRPLVLLGTAFNFVHLLDHFAANNMRYRLARGSRVLETGGYKGQSREVPKTELHALIGKHLGVAPEYIVTEYGMSELSSQAYDRVAGVQNPRPKVQGQPGASPLLFQFPPWCRAQVISPETGREVAEGETGLLRLFDLANVHSVMAIQAEDLAVRRDEGFELLGRVSVRAARVLIDELERGSMNRRKIVLFALLAVILVLAWNFREPMSIGWNMARQRFSKRTVEDRLKEFGGAARERWTPHFKAAGVTYPPKRIVFVALKKERMFEVWAEDETHSRLIRRYPILATSGRLGPKLREGDGQVPEGMYEIESLNPNSAYHVSLRLNYPNTFDRAQATKDGRTNLGGNIMIHGKSVSIGCLAMGDEAAEDVFTLAADAGLTKISVISAPVDFRLMDAPTTAQLPIWTGELYAQIKAAMTSLPLSK